MREAMTIDLDHMEELLKAATKGPWHTEIDQADQPNLYGADHWVAMLPHQCMRELEIEANANAAFIAAARTFIPEAIAKIRELEAELKSLEEHEFGRRPEQFPSD